MFSEKLLRDLIVSKKFDLLNFNEHKEKGSVLKLRDYPLIIKKHNSFLSAKIEIECSRIFSNFGNSIGVKIATPDFTGPVIVDEDVYIASSLISGRTLYNYFTSTNSNLDNNQFKLNLLIRDLALWHVLFSLGDSKDSPISLYRDAVSTNYMLSDDDEIHHIDFSSSNVNVHLFDDLALLLNDNMSFVNDSARGLEKYLFYRDEFNDLLGLGRVELEKKVGSNNSSLMLLDSYSNKLKSMGICDNDMFNKLKKINFTKLSYDDFFFFDIYRTMRVNYYKEVVWK